MGRQGLRAAEISIARAHYGSFREGARGLRSLYCPLFIILKGFDMKSGGIAIALTILIFSAVGFFVWLDEQAVRQAPPTLRPPHAQAPSSTVANVVAPRPPTPSPRGVYKCLSRGAVVYQDAPCGNTIAAPLAGGTLSVVSPPRPTLQVVQTTSNRPRTGVVGNPRSHNGEPDECPRLRKRIKNIDSAARHRSTSSLTEERRKTRDRMATLRCSEFD